MSDFSEYLRQNTELVNNSLEKIMAKSSFAGRESDGLDLMIDAMSYSLSSGGKRIRPFLTVEFCRLFGGDGEKALLPACALEMVHTYSLIHDDLPCMDNDDMRRGKPSNHIKFGYANALLAGDALLTMAFEVLLSDESISYEKRVKAAFELSKAAGPSGMVAGQVMDLKNENITASLDEIRKTDALKTGAMICAAGKIGCIVAGADEKQTENAMSYCRNIGLAFQITDDILDATSTDEVLGKPTGSDEKNNKSTYVSLLGLEKSGEYARKLTDEAISCISSYENSGMLIELAGYLCSRIN